MGGGTNGDKQRDPENKEFEEQNLEELEGLGRDIAHVSYQTEVIKESKGESEEEEEDEHDEEE